jgi:hypothetical protein
VPGIHAGSADRAASGLADGFLFVTLASDLALLSRGASEEINAARAAVAGTGIASD